MIENVEKLGSFYLGKIVDPFTGELNDNPLLYEAKNFTTHAVCLGMTGSGKTGLGIAILEEAGLDKIPALIIDPKGDLTNLLLTFPNLSPEEFKPWVDETEAERKGISLDEYAANVAKTWKDGLAEWGETSARIRNFRNNVDLTIYTPASHAGVPISILSSFAAPPKEQMQDSTAIRDRILSLTASLLGLLNINADPIKSRESILISTIIQQAWQNGDDLNIVALIQQVQKPPFSKIGALDTDTFYPAKERMELSIRLNNLLASPGFQAWMEGEPLDIQKLLFSPTGKPKFSILSIAHLSDSERMFFVTLFLNELLIWVRRQSGTSSLRALLYMDEIFGFFPPTAMPPSKLPMLTLLKQARAFGLGIVLATQNPVDIDYKGLANCGTWYIGKLQTERDKARVLEGLQIASNGEFDSNTLGKMLASTGKRMFIMRSIYEKNPILFQTRWTLSYLRGPLTLMQIARLTDKSKEGLEPVQEKVMPKMLSKVDSKPLVPVGINELYANENNQETPVHYEPRVLGIAKVHFVDAKNTIDVWEDVYCVTSAEEGGQSVNWEEGKDRGDDLKNQIKRNFVPGSTFSELPAGLTQEKNYAVFSKELARTLYQNQTFTLYRTIDSKAVSKEGELEKDFRLRMVYETRTCHEELEKKIREKYSKKIEFFSDKIKRAQDKVSQKQQKAWMQKFQAFIAFGTTLLGALFGRGVTKGTISQTGTSINRATRISKDSQEVSQAEESVASYQQQKQELEDQMKEEISLISIPMDSSEIKLDTIIIRPRKSDISVEKVVLLWQAEEK